MIAPVSTDSPQTLDDGAASAGSMRRYGIAAVDRALDLLEALARIAPATLSDLAKEARCTRTAAFRMLRTLQTRGFAIQDSARGMWRLGALWTTLGRASAGQDALAAAARPFLEALGRATGETVYLMVRAGLGSETVAEFRPPDMPKRPAESMNQLPLHAGPNRLLLAHAPDLVQAQVLAQRLPRYTPATPTDPRKIATDLPRLRDRGFLITVNEVLVGAMSVSAPVRDAGGQVIAILVLAAATLRMRPPRPQSLVRPVTEAAENLSRALGHRPKGTHPPRPNAWAPGILPPPGR